MRDERGMQYNFLDLRTNDILGSDVFEALHPVLRDRELIAELHKIYIGRIVLMLWLILLKV